MAREDARFSLITAGHHFLLDVLPFRRPESRYALARFEATATRINAPRFDLDLVLLRCLAVLSRHTTRVPSLLDQYLLNVRSCRDDLTRFSQCVEDLLRYYAIDDGRVQKAVQFVSMNYSSHHCTPQRIAATLGLRLSTLAVTFRNEMGCTMTEYIRDVRLEQAAILLATSDKSIKEIWAQIGYSHHSNFDHDFKRKFDCTPREHRARAIRPIAQQMFGMTDENPDAGSAASRAHTNDTAYGDKASVLIVDDDEGSRACLSRFLTSEGYAAFAAGSGVEGLTEAARLSPDIILLDYRMADIDGVEFLRRLRADLPGDAPHVALITADWNIFDRADEVCALRAMIVSKLCDLDQIRDVIDYLTTEPLATQAQSGSSQGFETSTNSIPLS